jgi:uncharacterized membrane protein YdfJ with MMPL/SSD domain
MQERPWRRAKPEPASHIRISKLSKPGVRVFRWPGSVFGARCSVLGVGPAPVPGTRSQVPDSRYPIPGTRNLVLVFENPHMGLARHKI